MGRSFSQNTGMKKGRSALKILTGKHTGKRPLGRPRRRWENNIRMDLEEIGINTRNWVDSAQYKITGESLELNLRVPQAPLFLEDNGSS